LLGERYLEVVAGHGFVEVLRRQIDARHFSEIAQVDIVDAG